MKLCDVHAHIGHWPFRRLPFTDPRSLLREMDRLEIERAAVCHTHGVFYKNCQSSNEELFADLARVRDRLFPVVTINPAYVGAERDFRLCVREHGAAGLRLVPQYHGYALDDPRAVALAAAAGEAGIPVLVPRLLVDPRQRHRLDIEETVSLPALASFARAVPGTTVLGVEYALGADAATVRTLREVPNLRFEISRVPFLVGRAVTELIEKIGADRLLFGTGMPFKVPEVSLLKMELLEDRAARESIGSRGFSALFRSGRSRSA
jgi:uncharacterized protein